MTVLPPDIVIIPHSLVQYDEEAGEIGSSKMSKQRRTCTQLDRQLRRKERIRREHWATRLQPNKLVQHVIITSKCVVGFSAAVMRVAPRQSSRTSEFRLKTTKNETFSANTCSLRGRMLGQSFRQESREWLHGELTCQGMPLCSFLIHLLPPCRQLRNSRTSFPAFAQYQYCRPFVKSLSNCVKGNNLAHQRSLGGGTCVHGPLRAPVPLQLASMVQ